MSLKRTLYDMLYAIEPKNHTVFRLCKLYVDRYRGENNRDKNRNGEYAYLKSTLPDCKVVVDAGAFQGDWTMQALEINPALQIHCFEPCKQNFGLLAKNVGSRAKINECGLSDADATADFFAFSKVGQASSLYRRDGSPSALGTQGTAETVLLKTLDGYSSEQGIKQIDLLKIDVEGHELAVLKGAARMLEESRIARIQFEYSSANIHSRVFFKDIYEFLRDFGYLVYKLYRSGRRPILEYSQELDNFQYANYVAERGITA